MKKLVFLLVAIYSLCCDAQTQKTNKIIFDTTKFSFIENTKAFNSIEDILKLEQFKNKVVYIDLWGYGCAACMREFTYLAPIKSKYKNKDVAYLYIYYKSQDSISSDVKNNYWIKYSVKNNLYGTHVLAFIEPPQKLINDHIVSLMERIKESKILTLDKDMYAIPRYMIADKKGEIKIFDAPRPHEKEKLFAMIDKLLNS